MLICVGVLLLLITTRPETARATQTEKWSQLEAAPYTGYRFADAHFPVRTIGWLVNATDVFKTADGGDSWVSQDLHGSGLRSVGFADTLSGWIGTLDAEAVLFETRDGGATWTDISNRIDGPPPTGICGIWVVDKETVYAVGRFDGPPRFLASQDGGESWTSRDLGRHLATLVDVQFFDRSRGLVVGGSEIGVGSRAVVLQTADGGRSWSVVHVSADLDEWAWKIFFLNDQLGFVAVESPSRGKLLRTSDGGLTWEELIVPGNRLLQAVGFISDSVGWIGGHGHTSMTADGGRSWSKVDAGHALNRVRLSGDSLLYAVGTQVLFYRISPPQDADPVTRTDSRERQDDS